MVEGEPGNEIIINDVSRAYFYAKCTRCLYVELPAEDPEAHPDFLGARGSAFSELAVRH